jgi:tetratricopeptide (TPR) repeat protein
LFFVPRKKKQQQQRTMQQQQQQQQVSLNQSPYEQVLQLVEELGNHLKKKSAVQPLLNHIFDIVGESVLNLTAVDVDNEEDVDNDGDIDEGDQKQLTWTQLSRLLLESVNLYYDDFIVSNPDKAALTILSKFLWKFYGIICMLASWDSSTEHYDSDEFQVYDLSAELRNYWLKSPNFKEWNSVCYYLLGVYHKEIARFSPKSFQMAIDVLQDCIKLHPDFVDAYVALCEVNEGLGLSQQNVELVDKYLQLPLFENDANSRSILLKYRSLAHFKLGMVDRGLIDYQNSLEVNQEQLLLAMPEIYETKLLNFVEYCSP